MRDWLIKAGISEHRVTSVLEIFDEEQVDTLDHLRVFITTPAFDARLKSSSAQSIRDALSTTKSSGAASSSAIRALPTSQADQGYVDVVNVRRHGETPHRSPGLMEHDTPKGIGRHLSLIHI